MVAVDWTRGDLEHGMTAQLVDPIGLERVRGRLDGLERTGTLTIDVDSDTRAKLQIKAFTDDDPRGGWDGESAVRLVHTVSDQTGELYRENLFTGIVRGLDWERRDGGYETTLSVESMLKAVELEVVSHTYVIGAGSHAVASFRELCGYASRLNRVDGDVREAVYGDTVAYDPGTTLLKMLRDMTDRAGGMLDVDGDGYLRLSRYVEPRDRAATYSASLDSERGTVIGPIEGADATLGMEGRYIVYSSTNDDWARGEALAPESAPSTRAKRGYLMDQFLNLNDLEPFTSAHARDLAQQYLSRDLNAASEMSHGLMYRPLTLRDVERLSVGGGSTRWYVKSADLDLSSWTWKASFKGGWR